MSFQSGVESTAVCPGCSEPVLANWKACPSCGNKLGTPAAPPLIQAGEGSVVKAQIDRSANVHGGAASQPAPSQPMIQAGEGSVIKAEINASRNTNVHHDNSLKVNGQFVANQTVVHESSVGTLVRMMTGAFSRTSAKEIEQSLPDTGPELFSILAQTLFGQIRQEKLQFKKERKLFGSGGDGNASNPWAQARAEKRRNEEAAERQTICQKILDKLHGIGQRSRDKQLLGDIEKLDNCLLETVAIKKTNATFKVFKIWGVLFAIGGVLSILLFLAGLLTGFNLAPMFTGFLGALVTVGPLVWGYFFFHKTVAKQEAKFTKVEADLDELLSRYTS